MQVDNIFQSIIEECKNILNTKGADYAEKGDSLAEIKETAKFTGVSERQVIANYVNKHYRAFGKWAKGEDLKGEDIRSKLVDIIVYCVLAYGLSVDEDEDPRALEREYDLSEEDKVWAEDCADRFAARDKRYQRFASRVVPHPVYVKADPPPRYDQIFAEGVAALNHDCGGYDTEEEAYLAGYFSGTDDDVPF